MLWCDRPISENFHLEIAIALEKSKAIRDKKKYKQIKLKAYRRIF